MTKFSTKTRDDELRQQITSHLSEWFRGLGIETHQIENSANLIMRLIAYHNRSLLEEIEKQWPEHQYDNVRDGFGKSNHKEGFNACLAECRAVIKSILEGK